MAVTPTSIETLPLRNMRNLVASSSAFQAWVSVGSETLALARIHYVDAIGKARPYAVVNPSEEGFALELSGALAAFEQSGTVRLMFVDDFDDGLDEPDNTLTFLNAVGDVLQEMAQRRGSTAVSNEPRSAFSRVERLAFGISNEDDNPDEARYIIALYEFGFEGSPV